MRIAEAKLALPVALVLLSPFVGCSSQPLTQSEEVRPVKTMVITTGETSSVRSFPGRVEASRTVDLAFQVPGVLANLPVKEGERVSQGAIIAQLRQDEFQARLKTVQAQLDQARSQLQVVETRLANTKTEFDRYSRLVGSTAVSVSEHDAAETAYRIAQDEQKSQEASVRGLEARLAEATLLGDSE